ncbi:MAG TPA: AAA-associated domain-containing protein [Verrucomicrobiae bacterium]|nr:AAA-associated domain-containing protein [Verrucomicrobiae bacterium]
MVMPFEEAWEKLVRERVDTTLDLVTLTKADIESVTGNELRLMAKVDFSDELPAALKRHSYFILPVKNGEYVLVRGNGYHTLEKLPKPPTIFRPQLDFELATLNVGDSESQHLDYSFHIGLVERFANVTGLRQTIRGRKRMPAIDFHVGQVGPIKVKTGVQVEVDLGCEGREDILLIEAKNGEPTDFIVRQLFYPYRKWRLEIPQKRTRPWFFCSTKVANKRLYKFWEYEFTDDDQYQSLKLIQGESFLIEPNRKRLTVDELLRVHVAGKARREFWNVPQADAFWRVAEIPLLVAQGIDTAGKIAAHYEFDPRQSSYYRQAAEFLGLVTSDKTHHYVLTDLGHEYANLPADERRQLLAGILAHFPPMRAALETLERAGKREVSKREIAALLERHSQIRASTPSRRASTILAWLQWLQSNTGAVRATQLGFTIQ